MSRFFPGHHAAWFVGLLLFWFALSGAWDLQHLLLGAAVAAAALTLRWRVAPHPPRRADGAGRRPRVGLSAPVHVAGYLVYLLVEVIKANVQVAMIVLNPKLPVSPAFLAYHPRLRSDWGRVLLANSVTLTPGTLTVELIGDSFLVHTLTRSAADALPAWAAERRVRDLETMFEGAAPGA